MDTEGVELLEKVVKIYSAENVRLRQENNRLQRYYSPLEMVLPLLAAFTLGIGVAVSYRDYQSMKQQAQYQQAEPSQHSPVEKVDYARYRVNTGGTFNHF